MSQFTKQQRRDDFALQIVPDAYRQWSWISLFSVMLGVASAMFYLAWGGDLMQMYGARDLIIGMVITTVIIGSVGFLLTTIACKTGLDMDLITSGAGFGYKGAGFTSFIYAISFLIFFAIEGSIIATAIHTQFPIIPIWILYIAVGAIFIPLTWYGITALNYIMWFTLPIYLILLIWSIILTLHTHNQVHFFSYTPTHLLNHAGGPALLQLLATTIPIFANATAATDVARFIPKRRILISTIAISYVLNGIVFLGATLLGAWFGLKLKQTNPGIYFPDLLGIWGVLFVILTQIRINVINTYSGSLALTTFFSRIFGFSPGRHWWIILMVLLSTILMFGGILTHLLQVLTFQAVFIIAWVMTVISYLLFNKKIFKISPENFPFQKGTIPNFNPIGISALVLALLIAVPMAFGLFGAYGKTLAPFVAAIISFMVVPIASFYTKTRALN